MPVNGNKSGSNHIKRKVFPGDLASYWKPSGQQEPTTARGRRRREKGKARPKAPGELIVGLAHRPHTHPKDLKPPMVKGHSLNETHARLISLTRAYKRNK